MAVVTFTTAEARAGSTTPLVWAQWTDSAAVLHKWSDRLFDDKTRRVVTWDPIVHALGSDEGQLAGSAMTIVVDDRDRAVRTLIATEATRYVAGQPVDLYVQSQTGRDSSLDPLRIFRGRWQHPRFRPGRLATLTAEDYVTILSDPAVMAKDIPQRRLAFGAMNRNDGFGEPIIYGTLSSTGLGSPGAISPIYIADLTIASIPCRVLMVAGHACKEITEIYFDGSPVPSDLYGTHVFAPDRAGWPFGTSYLEHEGRRYTAIAVKATAVDPKDLHRITLDVKGIETVGDGTGTLITGYFDAYVHFLKNFSGINGTANWQTGAWLSAPTWPDGSAMLDEASFTAAQNDSKTRMGDATGYIVRTVIGAGGARMPLQDVLQRWNVSGDVRPYVWDGKYGVVQRNRFAAATVTISEDDDLVESPPEFVPDSRHLVTHLDTASVPHYALHDVRIVTETDTAPDDHFVLRQPSIDFTQRKRHATNRPYAIKRNAERMFWMCDSATALNIRDEWLWQHQHAQPMAHFTMALPGLHLQPGTYVNVVHREGATDETTELCQVERLEMDLQQCRVAVQAIRVETGSISGFTDVTDALTDTDATPVDADGIRIDGTPVRIVLNVQRNLGGTIHLAGIRSTTAVEVRERRRVRLTESEYLGATVIARVEVRTDNAGTSVTPEIWDVTGTPALLVAGVASTSTTPAEQTINLTAFLTGTMVLELRIKGNNDHFYMFGAGRVEVTF